MKTSDHDPIAVLAEKEIIPCVACHPIEILMFMLEDVARMLRVFRERKELHPHDPFKVGDVVCRQELTYTGNFFGYGVIFDFKPSYFSVAHCGRGEHSIIDEYGYEMQYRSQEYGYEYGYKKYESQESYKFVHFDTLLGEGIYRVLGWDKDEKDGQVNLRCVAGGGTPHLVYSWEEVARRAAEGFLRSLQSEEEESYVAWYARVAEELLLRERRQLIMMPLNSQ